MKLRLLFLSLATMIIAASCGNIENETSEAKAAASGEAGTVTAASSGVTFKNFNGEVVNLDSYKDKVVVVNFWATWCGPCKVEMPSLQELYNKYEANENVAFFIVEVDNKPDLATRFATQNNYTFPLYSIGDNVPPQTFLGNAIPTTVILTKHGDIAYRHEGTTDFMSDAFINQFEGILNM